MPEFTPRHDEETFLERQEIALTHALTLSHTGDAADLALARGYLGQALSETRERIAISGRDPSATTNGMKRPARRFVVVGRRLWSRRRTSPQNTKGVR